MSEVNTDLASGPFQNYGVLQPSLDFWRCLAIECFDNTIGVELGENGIPKGKSKIPIYFPCDQITVKHHCGMWDPGENEKNETKISKSALS